MKLIEHFECVIESIGTNSFSARAVCVTNTDQHIFMQIPLIFIKEEDLEFFRLGAIFDRKIFEDGTSSIVFRKDRWTQEEIDQAEIEAAKLFEMFGNENIK